MVLSPTKYTRGIATEHSETMQRESSGMTIICPDEVRSQAKNDANSETEASEEEAADEEAPVIEQRRGRLLKDEKGRGRLSPRAS